MWKPNPLCHSSPNKLCTIVWILNRLSVSLLPCLLCLCSYVFILKYVLILTEIGFTISLINAVLHAHRCCFESEMQNKTTSFFVFFLTWYNFPLVKCDICAMFVVFCTMDCKAFMFYVTSCFRRIITHQDRVKFVLFMSQSVTLINGDNHCEVSWKF